MYKTCELMYKTCEPRKITFYGFRLLLPPLREAGPQGSAAPEVYGDKASFLQTPWQLPRHPWERTRHISSKAAALLTCIRCFHLPQQALPQGPPLCLARTQDLELKV